MMGARIAALRRQKHLSQQTLARMLEVSPSAVGMYEQGRREPSAALLVQMAEIFGVSTDYLLTGEAVCAQDLANPERILQRASSLLDAELVLRSRDGAERPMSREDLALLLAALLG